MSKGLIELKEKHSKPGGQIDPETAFKRIEQFSWKSMPHYRRLEIGEYLGFTGFFTIEEWSYFIHLLERQDMDTEMVLNFLMDENFSSPDRFEKLTQILHQMMNEGGIGATTNYSLIDTFIFPIRHVLSGSRHFTITDKTSQILAFSDLAKNAPASLFRLPFDTIYLQLSETPILDLEVYNIETGMHPFEGCYLVERTLERLPSTKMGLFNKLGYKKDQPYRTYDILSVGSSKDPSNAYDDATHFFKLYIQGDDRPITEIINIHIDHYRNFKHKEDGLTPMAQGEVETASKILEQIVKSLVYLNSDGVTKREFHELHALKKRINSVGAKKRGRLERKLEKTYDYTLIGPSGEAINYNAMNHSSVASGRKAHWRRGHQRWQPFGSREEPEYKSIWIEPMVIGAGEISGKNYKIK